MRFWREVIADRFSGGLLGILLAVSFAIQTLATGWAVAATVAPDPLHVLCTASSEGASGPADPLHKQACPCSELCGAGVQLHEASGPTEGVGVPIRFADRIERAVDPSSAHRAGPVFRPYHATGPPGLDPT